MNGMRVDSVWQAWMLLYSTLFGIAVYICYLPVSLLQRNRRIRVLAGIFIDIAYWTVVLSAFVLFVLVVCGGELRLYHLCGMLGGASLCAFVMQVCRRKPRAGLRRN